MELKKELPLIAIVLLPFIYLGSVWSELPNKVPMHWGVNGEVDRYGDKLEMLLIPFLLPVLIYVILMVIPKFDPKSRLNKMGNKLQTIKVILTTLMSILALLIIYSVKNQSFANPNYIILVVGVFFIIFGNYFKTIRTNYFLGIRTPWTLKNETVWKETHKLGGIMWFIGGFVVVLSSLILEKQLNMTVFLIITGIITLVPVTYSYIVFKKLKQTS